MMLRSLPPFVLGLALTATLSAHGQPDSPHDAITIAAGTAATTVEPGTAVADAGAGTTAWPIALPGPNVGFQVHAPIVDTWNDGILTARSLVLAQPQNGGPSIQGAVVFQAAAETDAGTGIVTLLEPQVMDVTFQTSGDRQAEWGEMLRATLPGAIQTVSLAQLEPGQTVAQARKQAATGTTAQPDVPHILVSETPAVLVYIDGPPRYVPVPGTELYGVANTNVLLINGGGGGYYLHLYDGWVNAPDLNGPWVISGPPPGIGPILRAARASGRVNLLPGKLDTNGNPASLREGPLPRIVVTQQHTALIVLDGPPHYVRVPGTGLYHAANTSAHLFLDETGMLYVRVGGNWYTSASLNGTNWQYVAVADLPAGFASIPADSPKGGVRASVARARRGAPAPLAQSTVVAANPATTQLSVIISGDPVIQPIKGSELNFVANASVPIIQVDINNWYAIENGVWFHSDQATGPWSVTSYVPPAIYAIPPTTPIYNAIHSRVLSSSTDVVYYDYPGGGGANFASSGGAIGVEDQGADYQYTPSSSMYWNWTY